MATSGNKQPKKRRGLASSPELQAAVLQYVEGGQTNAAEVRRLLTERGFDVPAERTIFDLIGEYAGFGSEPWTLAGATPDDIGYIAPVWAVALQNGARLTKRQALWVLRVDAAASDLPPEDVRDLAALYALYDQLARDPLYTRSPAAAPLAHFRLMMDALDALIAFKPWVTREHAERYFAAANSGQIPSPPLAWKLATKVLRGADKGALPSTVAFFGNQPEFSLIFKEDSATVRKEPKRAKKGRPQ